MTLASEFSRAYQQLSVASRVGHGSTLLRMLLDDDEPEVAKAWIQQMSDDVEAMLAGELRIEFHDDEINQLQNLINELRDAISGCESLEANHKYRLLRRLERLQKELHKEVSNLDSMWIFVGDAAFVLGQAAKDGKPIFELVREIMGIARIAMARTHGLPPGAIQDFLLEDKSVVPEPTSIAPVESPSS